MLSFDFNDDIEVKRRRNNGYSLFLLFNFSTEIQINFLDRALFTEMNALKILPTHTAEALFSFYLYRISLTQDFGERAVPGLAAQSNGKIHEMVDDLE